MSRERLSNSATTPCDRFEDSLFAGLNPSRTLKEHADSCTLCQESLTMTQSIKNELEPPPYSPMHKPQWISQLHHRALQKRQRARWALGGGLALAAASAFLFLAVRSMSAEDDIHLAYKKSDMLETSRDTQRPVWIPSSTTFSGQCSKVVTGLKCVGISSYRGSLDEAKAEARDVLLEQVAYDLAQTFQSEPFESTLRPAYSQARTTLMGAFSALDKTSPQYSPLYARIADVRHRTALALMGSAGEFVPKQHSGLYWEKYEDDVNGGTEYLAYVRYDFSAATLAHLQSIYTEEEEVGGGRAMIAYPLLAWSYPAFVGGVLVTGSTGKLEAAGPAGVIQSVGSKGKTVLVETPNQLARALESGGDLLLVKAAGDKD